MDPIRGLLIDLDGTLYVDGVPVPGAIEAIAGLRARNTPFCFATNTTRLPRRILVQRLHDLGIPVSPGQLHTAPLAAAACLREQGHRSILPLLDPSTLEDLADFDLLAPDAEAHADAVLVGDLGDQWSYEILNRAFRQLMDGAALVAINRNRYWKTADGLSLDAGPFVVALEHAAGVSSTIVGKPSPSFYASAVARLGRRPSETAMVGDDIAGDVAGAQAAGLRGILVRTGKFRPADLQQGIRPDFILDSLARILDVLEPEPR
ncbi:MAG: TIGR01458 family HAD-type hydrolase [Candidatus Eisenbacteria bacterium]